MKKILSIFIDESGDFGDYDNKAPYYLVAMVLHDQQIDITSEINNLDQRISDLGFPPPCNSCRTYNPKGIHI